MEVNILVMQNTKFLQDFFILRTLEKKISNVPYRAPLLLQNNYTLLLVSLILELGKFCGYFKHMECTYLSIVDCTKRYDYLKDILMCLNDN